MPINRHAVEVGVLTGVGNLLIFQHFMPPITDVKAGDQFDNMAEGSERTALVVAVAFSGLVATFVRSWDTFLIAGAVIIGVDFAYKHAIAVHPQTGTVAGPAGSEPLDTGNLHPLPTYTDAGQQ
jgi:hypothetical protein